MAECQEVRGRIASRALAELDTANDDLLVRALFTVQEGEHDLRPRTGYWLGDFLLRRLLDQHPSSTLLLWDHATARRALAQVLGGLV